MKKLISKIALVLSLGTAALSFTSCDILLSILLDSGTSSQSNGSGNTITGDETPVEYEVGDTKLIYVDKDLDNSVLKSAYGTLYAKSESSTTTAYVWVIDGYGTKTTSTDGKVNKTLCENLAKTFTDYVDSERAVFGNESEHMINTNSCITSKNMANISSTGDAVNIVIYGIDSDYSATHKGSGTVGYFWSKDYYQKSASYTGIKSYTNAGKYFYIDACFCNWNESLRSYIGNANEPSGIVVSTLFHEFQHMINFGQKTMGECSVDASGLDLTDTVTYDAESDYLFTMKPDTKSCSLPVSSAMEGYYVFAGNLNTGSSEITGTYVKSSTNLNTSVPSGLLLADKTGAFSTTSSMRGLESSSGLNVKHFIPAEDYVNVNGRVQARSLSCNESSEAWYNEMLSMLAEDMMADELGLSSSGSVWTERFPGFNAEYVKSGLSEYVSSDPIPSYETAYTFGAWLAREYGGVDFVGNMSKNNVCNMNSIRAAIKEYNSSADIPSSVQLYTRFMQAIAFEPDFSATKGFYTLNKAGATTKGNCKMEAHNLFDSTYSYSTANFKGPAIYSRNYQATLRPNGGIALHYLGYIAADSNIFTLTFSQAVQQNEVIQIYIQPAFSNKK